MKNLKEEEQDFFQGKTYKLNKGDCLIFNGKNKHCGVKISSGTRYI